MTEEQKEKIRECKRRWKRNNKEKHKKQKSESAKRNRLKTTVKKYGITVEEYAKMFSQQNGLCALCGKEDHRRLSIDHCHKTGIIRGLLCKRCNIALGYFDDDPMTVERAFRYLTRSY